MQMTAKAWLEYISGMSSIDQKAVTLMQQWIDKHGTDDRTGLIAYADALIQRYGQASGALACEMYEATAAAQGATVPAAEMASLPSYEEVGRAINGTLKDNQKVPNTVGRLVKRVGADTTLKNAKRDGAQFAWVPHGDTCAFCITLASRGWQYMSKDALRNGHAEHIHVNCDCQYAIRLDGKSTVEGYDPDKYLQMYENAEGKTPKDKINSMRRMLYQQSGRKIAITDQAIDKVKNLKINGFTDDESKQLQEMNKKILRTAKTQNNSNEVAMIWTHEAGVSEAVLGTEKRVDFLSNPSIASTLRNSQSRSAVLSHNHPSTLYFSTDDIGIFLSYPSIKTMEVVTNKGKTWHITKKDNYDDVAMIERYKNIISENLNKGLDEIVDIFLKSSYDAIERNG